MSAVVPEFASAPFKPDKSPPSPAAKPRFWPALALVVAYWIAWAVVKVFYPATFVQFLTLFYSPMLLGLGIIIWWLAFSRLPIMNRLWGVACVIACAAVAYVLADKSMNWMGLLMYALPIALTAEVLWLLITNGALTLVGWLGVAAASLLSFGYFTLLRVDGITASLVAQRSFRWTPTAEDEFLAEQRKLAANEKEQNKPAATDASPELVATANDWPEFRGALRDGVVHGVRIETDWTAHPPHAIWRRRVGPAWSSFSVIGDRVFTQEQRGESEAVICFDLASGDEIWSHEDKARFWEVVAGAGPRGTPTFHGGKTYSLGGSGKLNCLDAASGRLIWSQDIAKDSGSKPPQWGFSSSPLIVQGIAIVFAGHNVEGGKKDDKKDEPKKGVLGYDAATGDLRWTASQGAHSYSSPHLLKFAVTPTRSVSEGPPTQARSVSEGSDSVSEQVVMVSDHGLEAFEPTTGKLLWDHKWFLEGMFRVCQPQIIAGSQLLVGTGMGFGTRQVSIAKEGDAWKVTEGWTSKELKPYFNDAVIHDGNLYGFDGDILVCLDPATGKKKWKKGRYGHGQALLVGDQGLLIVISEKGEAILVEASPKDLSERGRFQALEGKTWNHPVLTTTGKLLVRNSEEMACYDLAPIAEARRTAGQ